MRETNDRHTDPTPWHRFLGKGLELSVGQEQVTVESELQVSSEPPRIDIVLLRRETPQWTQAQRALLPDGVRDTDAADILLEFKYSESLSQDALIQAVAYEYFYRTSRGMATEAVAAFVLCAKTPQARRLADFEYTATDLPGVYHSTNRYVEHVTLLVLNQLRAEPWNALVKTFASRRSEKNKAFVLLQEAWQLPLELSMMLDGLQTIWAVAEEIKMSEALTIERVMQIGKESKRLLLRHLSPEELDAYLSPDYKRKLQREGIEQGIYRTLSEILRRRLGAMPLAVDERLRVCTLAQLNTLVNPALDAATWEEFAAHLPALAND